MALTTDLVNRSNGLGKLEIGNRKLEHILLTLFSHVDHDWSFQLTQNGILVSQAQ